VTQFTVDLGSVGAQPDVGLSPAAAEVFGFKQQTKEVAMPEGKVEVARVPNMTVNSPRDLWDVLGSIQLSFVANATPDILENISAVHDLWAQLREDYEDELSAANRVSAAQLSFIRQLATERGEKVPEKVEAMSKEDASLLITEMLLHRGAKLVPAAQQQAQTAPAATHDSSAPGITVAQMKFIETLCKRAKRDVPSDLDAFSKREASDFIAELNGSK
jgi:hypothetical protein